MAINKILRTIGLLKTPEERAQKQLLSIKLNKSDIVIDCGANVGTISKTLANSGATIYCFEPNPYAFKALKDNLSDFPNAHCIPKGVGKKNSRMKLYLHEHSDQNEVYWSTGSSLLNFKSNVLVNKYIEVDIVDFSEFIRSLNSRIRILKMDVEGVECEILNKLINDGIINEIDFVFVETHENKIPELRTETDQLRKLIKSKNLKNINLNWE